MKKSIKLTTLSIAIIILTFSLVSCTNTVKPDEKNITSSDSKTINPAVTKEEENKDSLSALGASGAETSDKSDNNDGVGGGGADFDSYYHIGFCSVCFSVGSKDGKAVNFENTFVKDRNDEVIELINKYDNLIKTDNCRYQNTLWYLVKDLGLTRADIEAYESCMDESHVEKLTNEQIDALFIEDECEARNAMREPWTLFDGELVYTIKDIEKMTEDEFKHHNFKAEDIERLIDFFKQYPDSFDYSSFSEDRKDQAYKNSKETADYYINILTNLQK